MKILEGKKISKKFASAYPVEALKDVDVAFEEGTMNVIFGVSGSGKSTLLYILSTLLSPSSGTIFFKGKPISFKKDNDLCDFRLHNVGFIFQDFSLFDELTVYENIVFPLRVNHKKIDETYIQSIIKILGLKDKLKSMPFELSGGQQQRVAIARALANKPAVVFADEPTGNLDVDNTKEVIKLFKQLSDHYQMTMIVVTHDPSFIEVADQCVYLDNGRIKQA